MVDLFSNWKSLGLNTSELSCDRTLLGGQSFAWKKLQDLNREIYWVGVISKYAIALKHNNNDILWSVYPDPISQKEKEAIHNIIHKYFRVDLNITDLYNEWSKKDDHFATLSTKLPGIRLLDQDPFECLISFICSSNNNISRITSMLNTIRSNFGVHIVDQYYKFPTITSLSKVTEHNLIKLGFGYRAKYVVQTVKQLINLGGIVWLNNLRDNQSDDKVRTLLTQFTGVGEKVSSCVMLYSLNKLHIVPIDVHMARITEKYYKISCIKPKGLSSLINNHYIDLFGTKAGWAQCILFASDLLLKDVKIKKKRKKPDSNIVR